MYKNNQIVWGCVTEGSWCSYEHNTILLPSDEAPCKKRAAELLLQIQYGGLRPFDIDGSTPGLLNKFFFLQYQRSPL